MSKHEFILFHLHQLIFNIGMGAVILILIDYKIQNLVDAAKYFIPQKKKAMRAKPPLMMPSQIRGGLK